MTKTKGLFPAVPTAVTASDAINTYVGVTWTAAARATSYYVYRSTTLGDAGTRIGNVTATTFTDSTAAPATIYYYGIVAVNKWGASGLSKQDAGSIAGVLGPAITGISPTSGVIGASVTVTGTSFSGATAVKFNGVAATFIVNSSTSIAVSVPTTTSGPISVTSLAGTAISGTSFTVLSTPTATTTYYVDATAGNDSNNGLSVSVPWKTLAKVYASRAQFLPGDAILLKRGETWTETFNVDTLHGTSGKPITFGDYGSGTLPTIDAESTRDFCVYINDVTYVTFANLKAVNAVYDCFHVITNTGGNITNVSFNGCFAQGAGRDGFDIEGVPGVRDVDVILHTNCTATLVGRAGFFAYHCSSMPTGVHYYNCLATYAGQSIAAHGFSGYYANNIHYHQCEASLTNIDPNTAMPNAYTTEGHGFVFDDFCGNSSVEYCYSHDNQGWGIALAHQAANNLAIGNVVTNNLHGGIIINGSSGGSPNIKVYNNSLYGNTGNGIEADQPATVDIQNNIVSTSTGYGIQFSASGVTGTVNKNILFTNTLGATANVSGATNTSTADPVFANTGTSDFSLQVSSPAIDVGAVLGSAYQTGLSSTSVWPLAVVLLNQYNYGTGWEIGAYVSA